MNYFEIIVANKYALKKYVYYAENEISKNTIVSLQFNKKKCLGIVANVLTNQQFQNVLKIQDIYSNQVSDKFLEFIQFVTDYNLTSIGSILEMALMENYEKALPIWYEKKAENHFQKIEEFLDNKNEVIGFENLEKISQQLFKIEFDEKKDDFFKLFEEFVENYFDQDLNLVQKIISKVQNAENFSKLLDASFEIINLSEKILNTDIKNSENFSKEFISCDLLKKNKKNVDLLKHNSEIAQKFLKKLNLSYLKLEKFFENNGLQNELFKKLIKNIENEMKLELFLSLNFIKNEEKSTDLKFIKLIEEMENFSKNSTYSANCESLIELLQKGWVKKDIKKLKLWNEEIKKESFIILDDDQKNCVEAIQNSNGVNFLYGATGSGKTIVAIESFINEEVLKNGKILIITPEISLTNNWFQILKKIFKKSPLIYHYKLSESYKKSVYKWALSDEGGIIIGARSALFLPYKNLQRIIIDEEHSSSLKQDRFPKYHARDMAVARAKIEKIPILMLSATPSLETLYNIENKKYNSFKLLRNPKFGGADVVFKKINRGEIISNETIAEIQDQFEKNQQILFFLNRKGYFPYCFCTSCNVPLKCTACDHFQTLYKNYSLMCHKCGKISEMPKYCGSCKQKANWRFFGIGVEKLFDYLQTLFLDKKFITITSDNENMDDDLKKIDEKQVHGIIATQVLTQGHDFKHIGLCVIIDSELGANSIDFRSMEKVFQQWMQIKGRSGRHNIKGKMIVQYVSDENKFIKLFQAKNPYNYLMEERKKENWPPFSKCAFLVFKSKSKEKMEIELEKIKFKKTDEVEIFGPIYFQMHLYIHEWRFLVRVPKNSNIQIILKNLAVQIPKKLKVEFEIDPYTF